MTPSPTGTKCLYYPYSRSINLNTLKKAVLLFDEVDFVDSQPWFIRSELLDEVIPNVSSHIVSSLRSNYLLLQKAGVAKIIDPAKTIREYDSLVTANVVNDLRSRQFCESAIRHDVTVWDVLTERIPKSFLRKFYPGVGTFSEAISLQGLIKENGQADKLPSSMREFAKLRWKGVDEKEAWRIFNRSNYEFVIGGNPHAKLEVYQIPFLQASSLRLNEALLLCAMTGNVPLTDSPVHDRLMRTKVGRSLKSLENPNLRKQLEIELPLRLPQHHLALEVLDNLISERDFDKRSISEILDYRSDNQAELRKFREKIGELAAEIDLITPGPEYYLRLRRIINSKVIPEISKMRDEVRASYEKTFGGILKQSAKVMVPSLIITVFAGLSFWQMIGICGAAEASMFSVKGLDDVIDLWNAHKGSQKSAFSYLTRF